MLARQQSANPLRVMKYAFSHPFRLPSAVEKSVTGALPFILQRPAKQVSHGVRLRSSLYRLRRAWLMRRRALPLQGRKSAAPFRAVALLLRAKPQSKNADKSAARIEPRAVSCAFMLRPPRGPAPDAGCSFSRAVSSWGQGRPRRSSPPLHRGRFSRQRPQASVRPSSP